MALSVRDLRRRIADGITTRLGIHGWLESRYAPELFGQDTREQRHLGFSVGVPNSAPADLDRQSTHGGAGLRATVATTAVTVRWGFRLRASGQAEDYDAALEAEAKLVEALLEVDRSPDLGLRLLTLARTVISGDEVLLIGTVSLECLHRLPLG